MHRMAIMQPYLFPYIGYWQLIKSVDRFVIYDDVNYIKGGWINRNRILVNGQATFITIPLVQASPYDTIQSVRMQPGRRWRDKLSRSLTLTYARSPHFETIWPRLSCIIDFDTDDLTEFLTHQFRVLSQCLGLGATFERASTHYPLDDKTGQARVIEICRRGGASHYVNSIGGRELYDGAAFRAQGIHLHFLSCNMPPYPQRMPEFVPHLSIVDVLMNLGIDETVRRLDAYELVEAPTDLQTCHAA